MKFTDKIPDQAFRLYRIIGRELIKHSPNPRPSSPPFITGDGFRAIANHIYDNTNLALNPENIKQGQVVFVGDSLIEKFLHEIHPKIQSHYVLVTHNGDAKITKEVFDLASDKIIRWYGINVEYSDQRITPIPLGIENKHYYVCGIPSVFNFVKRRYVSKLDKIFYGFTVATNPEERGPALEIIKSHPNSATLDSWRGFFPYLLSLNKFKFVLSPPGSCEEGHRTWDTMYIGGVPIVKSSITTEYFKSEGVPLMVIKDWDELRKLNTEAISNTYNEILAEGSQEALSLDFWTRKIQNKES